VIETNPLVDGSVQVRQFVGDPPTLFASWIFTPGIEPGSVWIKNLVVEGGGGMTRSAWAELLATAGRHGWANLLDYVMPADDPPFGTVWPDDVNRTPIKPIVDGDIALL
jgi:hypothetical protein